MRKQVKGLTIKSIVMVLLATDLQNQQIEQHNSTHTKANNSKEIESNKDKRCKMNTSNYVVQSQRTYIHERKRNWSTLVQERSLCTNRILLGSFKVEIITSRIPNLTISLSYTPIFLSLRWWDLTATACP